MVKLRVTDHYEESPPGSSDVSHKSMTEPNIAISEESKAADYVGADPWLALGFSIAALAEFTVLNYFASQSKWLVPLSLYRSPMTKLKGSQSYHSKAAVP